jgi:Na+/H+ antiporter NhaA
MALLCGIGFHDEPVHHRTGLSGQPDLVEAKLGILGGSLLSALAGALVLRLARALRTDRQKRSNYPSIVMKLSACSGV